jgi:hypothetical protein
MSEREKKTDESIENESEMRKKVRKSGMRKKIFGDGHG